MVCQRYYGTEYYATVCIWHQKVLCVCLLRLEKVAIVRPAAAVVCYCAYVWHHVEICYVRLVSAVWDKVCAVREYISESIIFAYVICGIRTRSDDI